MATHGDYHEALEIKLMYIPSIRYHSYLLSAMSLFHIVVSWVRLCHFTSSLLPGVDVDPKLPIVNHAITIAYMLTIIIANKLLRVFLATALL